MLGTVNGWLLGLACISLRIVVVSVVLNAEIVLGILFLGLDLVVALFLNVP